MLTFAELERALKPISRVGMDEVQFNARGDVIVLRPIRPQEEVQVGRYAREVVADTPPGEDPDQHAAMEYINRYKVMTLAFAIVQINDVDMRNEGYVLLPEKTDAGRHIRVPKHVAMRDLILKMWSPTLIRAAHTTYSNLLKSIEREYVDLVENSPADLDTEIARLEEELAKLKAERESRATGDASVSKNDLDKLFTTPKPPEPPKPPSPSVATLEPEEDTITMDRMPTAADYQDLEEGYEEEPIPESPLPPPPAQAPRRPEPVEIQDSFADPDDPEVMAAEEARILAARRAAAASRRESMTAQATATRPPRRTPPHMRGREAGLTDSEVRAATPEELAALGIPPNMAQPEDPTPQVPETLSPRGRRHRSQQEGPEINPDQPDPKTRNRRFVPPKGRRGG